MIPAIVLFTVTYVLMLTFSKFRTNPVPFIIGIAVSSNLQGAATLVGDTTAIMLGSALDMSFVDFFWYKGKPSMFFAVEQFFRRLYWLLYFEKKRLLFRKREIEQL